MTGSVPALRIGLLVNPFSGLGGPRAQKGSDHSGLALQAVREGWPLSAPARAALFLQTLPASDYTWVCAPGIMGRDHLQPFGASFETITHPLSEVTSADDTRAITQAICVCGVDVLVFVGGDGTARDVLDALPQGQLALGVPAGVKMQSGVYAITPKAAAQVIMQLAQGALVRAEAQEVRDIDEAGLLKGIVKSCRYGEMLTPLAPEYVQHVKQGGMEVEALVILDMAEHLQATLPEDALIIVGPGSTTNEILKCWHLEGSLLGVDVVQAGLVVAKDITAERLESLVDEAIAPVFIVITAIGGQGHILGRGNQQISPKVLKAVGRDHLRVVCTKTKLSKLQGRPLLMDSGDAQLDEAWEGLIPVVAGFQDEVMVRLGSLEQA